MSSISSSISKTMIRQLLVIVIQLVIVVFTARILGPEKNGHFLISILFLAMLTNFLNFGISPATIYFLNTKQFDKETIYFSNLIIWGGIAILGLIAGYFLLSIFGETLFPNIPITYLYLALSIFPFSLLYSFLIAVLQAEEKFTSYNIALLSQPSSFLLLLFILYFGDIFIVENVIFANLCSVFIGLLFSIFLSYEKTLKIIRWSSIVTYLTKAIWYGFRSFLANMVAFLQTRIDTFMLNYLINPVAAVIYFTAAHIAEKLWIFPNVMSVVLLPRLASLEKKEPSRGVLIAQSYRYVIVIVSLLSMVLSVVAVPLIDLLFGDDYASASLVVIVLLPGIILGSGNKILANSIASSGRPEINLYTSLFVLIVNIAMNSLLIPILGVLGAALSTSIAYILNAILRIWIACRLEKCVIFSSLVPKLADLQYMYHFIENYLRRKKNA